jgi:hypothetical protein
MGHDSTGIWAIVALGAILVLYVWCGICLKIIADKTGTENSWLAWVPIGNMILMSNIAQKPIWWGLLLLVPYVNVVMMVLIWMKIAERRNFQSWMGFLMLIPVVSLGVMGYVAFAEGSNS